jgi:hypothetical protein
MTVEEAFIVIRRALGHLPKAQRIALVPALNIIARVVTEHHQNERGS